MIDILLTLGTFCAVMIACAALVEGGVRFSKWLTWERTRKQQERQYVEWAKRQQEDRWRRTQ